MNKDHEYVAAQPITTALQRLPVGTTIHETDNLAPHTIEGLKASKKIVKAETKAAVKALENAEVAAEVVNQEVGAAIPAEVEVGDRSRRR